MIDSCGHVAALATVSLSDASRCDIDGKLPRMVAYRAGHVQDVAEVRGL